MDSVSAPLGAVVILVPQHFHFLARLVENINESQPPFHDVVIVASGFPLSLRPKLKRLVGKINVPTKVMFTELGSAGQNRNAGSMASSAELVAFLDADDYFAPDRNSIALEVFNKTHFDLFYHSFLPFENFQDLREIAFPSDAGSVEDLVFSESLFETTFPNDHRDRKEELAGRAQSTNLIVPNEFGAFQIHHAHVICRAEVARRIRFHEIFGMRNEDGVFGRDALQMGLKIVCSPLILSGYQQGARAKPRKPGNLPRRIANLLRASARQPGRPS